MKWGAGQSLRTLLIAQFLIVALVAGLVATAMVVTWRLPMARQQTQVEQARAASLVLQQLEGLLDTTESLTHSIGRMLGQEKARGSRAAALALVARLAASTDLFESLYLLDKDATVVALGSSVVTGPMADEWIGNDLGGLPVVQAMRSGKTLAWSEQFQSPLLGVPVVALAIAVGDEVLMAEISVRRLVAFVRDANNLDGLLVLVADGKGELVAAPDAQLARQRTNLSNNPLVHAALQGAPVFAEFDFAGQAYAGTAQRSTRLGWVVLAAYPATIAHAARQVALVITSVTLLVSVGLGMFLFGAFADRIGRRVQRTVAYAQAVAERRYDAPAGQTVVRELQALDASLAQMAQTIQRREQQLNAIVETTPTLAIQWYDRQGRVQDWNPASHSMLGWSRQEALGKTLAELIYTPAQQQDFMQVLADIEATGQPFGPYEGAVRVRDGTERYLLSTTFSIPDMVDGLLFVCMDLDITEKRRMENDLRELNADLEQRILKRTHSLTQANQDLQQALEDLQQIQAQLVQSEKLASLGALVAGIAHELNTPIGNGLMAISTLEQRSKAFRAQVASGLRRSDLEAYLQQVETGGAIATRNLERAAELITGFKRVAVDQTSVQRREFDLAVLVREILLTLQPMIKRSPVQVQTQVEPVMIDGYPGPLGQVISNLVQNSLVHAFGEQQKGVIRISAKTLGERVELTLDDDGCGVPHALVRRVFDPFFTTRLGKGGSGLGLHIVHNIVTGMLGGQIELQQRPESGACFVVNFPRVAPPLADAPMPSHPQPETQGR